MPELEKITWVLALILGEYIMVLFAVIADLISGVRKAKARSEARRSKAFRRTVDKIARYYNALFALTVIDIMQIAGIIYLRVVEEFTSLPLLPIFTLIGSLGIALIEVKRGQSENPVAVSIFYAHNNDNLNRKKGMSETPLN